MKNKFSVNPGPGNKGLRINLSRKEAITCGIGLTGFIGWLVFKNNNKNKNTDFLDDFDDSII